MLNTLPIYVEARIRGSVDEIWRLTQDPRLHERWDLRFSSIEYLPESGQARQRFRYRTRLGLLDIEGWGEAIGEKLTERQRTSALKFGSESPLSLIREGSGYWKYEGLDKEVRFVTGFDYKVRWGTLGRLIDRVFLRPLMGWATAWSFDRLRLWIEEGAEPERLGRQAAIRLLAGAGVAFVWIWQGLIPKLAGPHPDELAMLLEAGVPVGWTEPITLLAGLLEVAFGIAFLPLAHYRWPWWLTIFLMLLATVGVAVQFPARALAAFNPISLNVQLALLAAIGLLSRQGLPSAGRCSRAPGE